MDNNAVADKTAKGKAGNAYLRSNKGLADLHIESPMLY